MDHGGAADPAAHGPICLETTPEAVTAQGSPERSRGRKEGLEGSVCLSRYRRYTPEAPERGPIVGTERRGLARHEKRPDRV